MSVLQANTYNILNAIRENASQKYQDLVPVVEKAEDLVAVGEILQGYPALANEWISTLMNQIARVMINNLDFVNPYGRLNKGTLTYGELIEDIFIELAKVEEFSYDKAPKRELQRTPADVRAAFYTMNWNVLYKTTISRKDLPKAFSSDTGVTNFIAKQVETIVKAMEYDEFLLYKYTIIKQVTKGNVYPIDIGDGTTLTKAATAMRATSGNFTFPSTKYNQAGVRNNAPVEKQVIFMDNQFEADFDVNVLANAFNMDRATYIGQRYRIDNWSEFDNERFEEIRAASDMLEEVTDDELAIMKDVVAFFADSDWFQFYDNIQPMFTEKYVAAGDYWNYFYHVQKTVAVSPYANAVVFVKSTQSTALPETFTATVTGVSKAKGGTAIVVTADDITGVVGGNVNYVQDEAATEAGVAVLPIGGVLYGGAKSTPVTLTATLGGTEYKAGATISPATTVGTTLTFTKVEAATE